MTGTFIHTERDCQQFIRKRVYTEQEYDSLMRINSLKEDTLEYMKEDKRLSRILGAVVLIAGSLVGGLSGAAVGGASYRSQLNLIQAAATEMLQHGAKPVYGQKEAFTMPDGDVYTAKIVSVASDIGTDGKSELCIVLQRPDGNQITACIDTPKGP